MGLTFKQMLANGYNKPAFSIAASDLSEVTSIVDNCFRGCNKIMGITINGNVRTVGKQAFYSINKDGTSLSYIKLNEGVLWIRERAFSNIGSSTNAVTSLTLPSTLKKIEKEAFQWTPLGSLTFGKDGGVEIEDGAFQWSLTDFITTLDLAGVSKIGEYAFTTYNSTVVYTCKNSTLVIGHTLQKLGDYAFGGGVKENDGDTDYTYAFKAVDSSAMNPMLEGGGLALQNTGWFRNMAAPTTGMTYATLANGKFLVGVKSNDNSVGTTLYVPDGVVNMGANAIYSIYSTVSDINPTVGVYKVVIPDTVVWMQKNNCLQGGNLRAVDIGSSVSRIDTNVIGNSVYSIPSGSYLVFRQPRNMDIAIGAKLAAPKDATQLDIYTDNLVIRSYDWAGDNITPIFHPLSEAPSR